MSQNGKLRLHWETQLQRPSSQAAKLGRRDFPVFSSPESLSNSYSFFSNIVLAYYWHTGMPKYDLEETPIYEIYMFKKKTNTKETTTGMLKQCLLYSVDIITTFSYIVDIGCKKYLAELVSIFSASRNLVYLSCWLTLPQYPGASVHHVTHVWHMWMWWCDDVMMWCLLEKENVASVVWGKDRKGGNGWVDGIWWKLWKFSWIFPSILHWFLSALHTFQKACHIAAHVARRHWHRIRAHHPVKLLKNFERRGGEMSVFFFMRKLAVPATGPWPLLVNIGFSTERLKNKKRLKNTLHFEASAFSHPIASQLLHNRQCLASGNQAVWIGVGCQAVACGNNYKKHSNIMQSLSNYQSLSIILNHHGCDLKFSPFCWCLIPCNCSNENWDILTSSHQGFLKFLHPSRRPNCPKNGVDSMSSLLWLCLHSSSGNAFGEMSWGQRQEQLQATKRYNTWKNISEWWI